MIIQNPCNSGNQLEKNKQHLTMNTTSFKIITKAVLLLIILFFVSMAVFAQQNPLVKEQHKEDRAELSFPKPGQFINTKLEYKIIPAINNTYGYDIYADGKLMIHQNSIPAMPGNEGFKTKASAEKVAQLVIQKIKKGEMPPTVSVEELNKLQLKDL